ncbi:hypothetical protein PNEG_00233 [Pneumocystis murina B123]|uniref:HRDC domain-containing protein n=1 Tax=Pneumocystis murina (strain B123) TaxID=1069680 RepID=M7NWZ9_PNEMU|nr:hypothetical protein PNEG_00233 [Pneumocystis murina B123]EMR11807.1 hypothetical protein PNEG_00233 [Pneumocystis murina B123]
MDPALFSNFQDQLYDSLISATKAVTVIGSQDINFYCSLDPYFASSLANCNKRFLDLINYLVHLVSSGRFGKIEDHDDLNYKWWDIIDIIDSLFEKADISLDEFTEFFRRSDNKIEQNIPKFSKTLKKKKQLAHKFIHEENISKPQFRFSVVPDNNPDTPWKRKITVKPNALVPLDDCILESNDKGYKTGSLPHPYEYEINNIRYSEELFKEKKPMDPVSFNDSKAIWVDTVEILKEMLKDLKNTAEIAVDLEHHDYRSYQGFVCLMQISTRRVDWIVDTLELREELEILNEVFTDSNIIKVFHGASMDIIWLQRDFGLYIVGLFDTYHATKILEFEGHSLAFLLKKYVNFNTDKRYQLADWRIRPLPEEMLSYARSDTHFLLYIYDHLKNELLLKSTLTHNLLLSVFSASNNVALRIFEKDKYDADGSGVDGWKSILQKWSNCLTCDLQVSVLVALHKWRDKVARQEDESVRYVLPNHILAQIAINCPKDAASIFAICNNVPPLVRIHVDEIVRIIQLTKEDELKKSSLSNSSEVISKVQNIDISDKSIIMDDVDFINHDKLFENDIANEKLICLVTETSLFWGKTIENCYLKDSRLSIIEGILRNMKLVVSLPFFSEKMFVDNRISINDNSDLSINNNNDLFIDEDKVSVNKYDAIDDISIEKEQKQDQSDDIIVVKKLGNKQKRLFEISENKSEDVTVKEDKEFLGEFGRNLSLDNFPGNSKKRKKRKLNKKAKLKGKFLNYNGDSEPYDYEKDPSFFNQLNTNYELRNENMKLFMNTSVNQFEKQLERPRCKNAPSSGLRSMVFGK